MDKFNIKSTNQYFRRRCEPRTMYHVLGTVSKDSSVPSVRNSPSHLSNAKIARVLCAPSIGTTKRQRNRSCPSSSQYKFLCASAGKGCATGPSDDRAWRSTGIAICCSGWLAHHHSIETWLKPRMLHFVTSDI